MTHDPSYFSDKSQGGLRGDRGFTAQTVVLLHRLPALFDNPEFAGVVYEGQEDFDLLFNRPQGQQTHAVQCKAKPLTNPDVREIVDGMHASYLLDPGQYECFEIVAQAFPPRVEAVRLGSTSITQAQAAYPDTPIATKTLLDFDDLIQAMLTELKCSPTISVNWVKQYLKFSTEMPSFPFAEHKIVNTFASECTDCQQFGVQILAPFRVAAAMLQQKFKLNIREPISRLELVKIVHDACAAYKEKVQQEGVKIHIDHWRDQDGKAIISADQVFNWRPEYEGAKPSGIPARDITTRLLNELQAFETKSMQIWREAEVELLHPCSLSAAFAVGHSFRQTKGYRLTVTVPGGAWTFDEDMAAPSEIELRTIADVPGSDNKNVILALGVGRDIDNAVEQFATERGLSYRRVTLQTSMDRLSELQARRVASDIIRMMRDFYSNGLRVLHLFYAGPMALAAMIGSLMNKIGKVMIYELDYLDEYRLAFEIQT